MEKLFWYAFFAIATLFFLYICYGVTKEYLGELKLTGFKKILAFLVIFVICAILLVSFSGSVPEIGR